MKLEPLGRTSIQACGPCFGALSFGGEADEAASAAMYRTCRDAGIHFFDCADQYTRGEAERILGRLIGGHRGEVVIATKCFNPTGPDSNARGSSRRHVSRALDVQPAHGRARLEGIEPMHDLVRRQAEVEILPMAEANGPAVSPCSPGAAGLLSGRCR